MARVVVVFLVLCLAVVLVRADEEFVGPFSSWANVKTGFGAVGDGKADDTGALQKALDTLGAAEPGHAAVLFLPVGTYRLTRGLALTAHLDCSVIGEDPAHTTITWDGGDAGVMLKCNGEGRIRLNRLTWNGAHKRITAVSYACDSRTGGLENADEIFRDLSCGIRGITGGKAPVTEAICPVLRCKFLRCGELGIGLEGENVLSWPIWDCEFDTCTIGVGNEPGGGQFQVYRSIFRASHIADITMRNAGNYAIRHCTSVNSKTFLTTEKINKGSMPLSIQHNTIIKPTERVAISIANPDTAVLLDNTILSTSGLHAGPVVAMTAPADNDLVSAGNSFTLLAPLSAKGRVQEVDSRQLFSAGLKPMMPYLPETPRNWQRPIIEVPTGADAPAIQAAIDKAAALNGKRPVVHLPAGNYAIATTLTVPAQTDIQLIGDGYRTNLRWTGAADGVLLRLHGPTQAILRDCVFSGDGKAVGVVAENADQLGARVFGEQASVCSTGTGVQVELAKTAVELHNFTHAGDKLAVKVAYSASADTAGMHSQTAIFGGTAGENGQCYDVTGDGALLVADVRYADASPLAKLTDAGTFTLTGTGNTIDKPAADPGVMLENFRGKAAFVSDLFGTRMAVKGEGKDTQALLLGTLAGSADFLDNTATKAHVELLNVRQVTPNTEQLSTPVANQGSAQPLWLYTMLTQLRTLYPRPLGALPGEMTDLRLYHVRIENCTTGLWVKGK